MNEPFVPIEENFNISKLTMIDAFFVLGINFLVVVAIYLFCDFFFEGETLRNSFRFFSPITFMLFTFLWIRLKYNMTPKDIGFKKSEYPLKIIIPLCMFTAFIYVLLFSYTPLWHNPHPEDLILKYKYFSFILIPFSFNGFYLTILSPISGETLFRGFFYCVLRNKYGVLNAIIILTVLYSIINIHYSEGLLFFQFLVKLFPGFILVLLVEKSKSIYPAIIFQSSINYFSLLFVMLA